MRTLHTFETVEKLKTRGQFRKAYKRNSADQSKMTTRFIDAGRGSWRPNNEIKSAAEQGDSMAREYFALVDEAYVLGARAERFFGMQPYMV